MKRTKVVWPYIHARAEDLRGTIVKSINPVLHSGKQLNELLVRNVFNVQQELIYLSRFK